MTSNNRRKTKLNNKESSKKKRPKSAKAKANLRRKRKEKSKIEKKKKLVSIAVKLSVGTLVSIPLISLGSLYYGNYVSNALYSCNLGVNESCAYLFNLNKDEPVTRETVHPLNRLNIKNLYLTKKSNGDKVDAFEPFVAKHSKKAIKSGRYRMEKHSSINGDISFKFYDKFIPHPILTIGSLNDYLYEETFDDYISKEKSASWFDNGLNGLSFILNPGEYKNGSLKIAHYPSRSINDNLHGTPYAFYFYTYDGERTQYSSDDSYERVQTHNITETINHGRNQFELPSSKPGFEANEYGVESYPRFKIEFDRKITQRDENTILEKMLYDSRFDFKILDEVAKHTKSDFNIELGMWSFTTPTFSGNRSLTASYEVKDRGIITIDDVANREWIFNRRFFAGTNFIKGGDTSSYDRFESTNDRNINFDKFLKTISDYAEFSESYGSRGYQWNVMRQQLINSSNSEQSIDKNRSTPVLRNKFNSESFGGSNKSQLEDPSYQEFIKNNEMRKN